MQHKWLSHDTTVLLCKGVPYILTYKRINRGASFRKLENGDSVKQAIEQFKRNKTLFV